MTESSTVAPVAPNPNIPPVAPEIKPPVDPTSSIPPAPPNSPSAGPIIPNKRKRNYAPTVTTGSHQPISTIIIPNAEQILAAPTKVEDIPSEVEDKSSIPQYEIDFDESEVLAFTKDYWIGLTADAPFQYVSVPGAMLYKFVEPVEGKNSKGEANSVPKRGQDMSLTEAGRDKLIKVILNRGIYFTGKDMKSGRDFRLPVDYKSYNKWSRYIHPMGWYVYFIAAADMVNLRVGDHRSIGAKGYVPKTLVKRPETMGHGFEMSVMPDLKLEKDTEFFTLKLPKGRI